MKILLIHNKYFHRGGEDLVYESERDILIRNGHEVESMVFTNEQISSLWTKLTVALGAVYNRKSHRLLLEKIKSFGPDVIHVHNFFHIASPSIFFAAYSSGVPVVMTLHNFRLICPSATLFFEGDIYEKSVDKIFPMDAVLKGVYRNSRVETLLVVLVTGIHKLLGTWRGKVNQYIALTDFSRRKILGSSLKITENQIVVKPNFVEDYGANLLLRSEHFLYVGRLSEEKGIKMLLESASKQSEITYKIIGDGPLRAYVEDFAATHTNVEYLGFRDKEYIISELKQAKALVFPSQWYEGFPMTILEAFSCGTPVIASDLGGPGEVITHGTNGLLFDYHSSDALLLAIDRLRKKGALYQQLSRNARRSYEELYTPESNYHQLMKIYTKAILL